MVEDWTLDALGDWSGYAKKTCGSTDLNRAGGFGLEMSASSLAPHSSITAQAVSIFPKGALT